jgi:hypothetical protein
VYVPESGVWQITWIDPAAESVSSMVGRRDGDDIVQEYRDDSDSVWQWRFTDITEDSFRWIALESTDDGQSWDLRNEFLLARRFQE